MADADRSSTAAGTFRLLIILFLGGAATFPYLVKSSTSATQAAGTDRSAAAASTKSADREDDPPPDAWKLLADFVGVDVSEKTLRAKAPIPVRSINDLRHILVKEAFKARDIAPPQFVIATVPDPIDSNARWTFDAIGGALQSAAAANKFVLDRFYMPDWDPARDGSGAGSTGRIAHESRPALILFRDANFGASPARRRLLLVQLVAETPTGGIHQVAFQNALKAVVEWHDGRAPAIAVLGPTFSGSTPSLAVAIRNFRQQHPAGAMHIVTGTATAYSNRELITRESSATFPVTFTSTVIPDEFTTRKTIEYLIDTDRDLAKRRRLALLVEDNTTYGTQLQRTERDGRVKTNAPCSNLIQGEQAACVLETARIFPFPLHISRLRFAAAAQPTRQADNRPRFLTLPLGEPGVATDQIPSLTPQSTSASVELVLDNILDTIVREHITTVGLLATDTRDKLFLAEQIARRDSRVRLFTFESDLLYTHPDYGPYLRGMIVASTYPLFSQVQGWTTATTREIQFPTSNVQGVYNAFIALFRQQLMNLSEDVDPLDYRTPLTGAERPPLWISAVGRNSLWPIRWYGLDAPLSSESVTKEIKAEEDEKYEHARNYVSAMSSHEADASSVMPHASTTSAAMFFLLTLIVFSHVAAYTTKRWWPASYAQRPFLEFFKLDTWVRRSPYLLIAFSALTVLYGYTVTVLVSVSPRGSDAGERRWLSVLVVFALLLLAWLLACDLRLARTVAAGGFARLRQLRSKRAQRSRRGLWALADPQYWLMGVTAVWVGVAVIFGVQYLLATVSLDRKLAAYYFDRVSHPTNGLSPAMPLLYLVAGVYFWAVVHLRRLSRVSGLELAAALTPLVGLSLDSLRRAAADVRRFIDGSLQALPRDLTAALCVIAAFTSVFSLKHTVASPEPWAFVEGFKAAWVLLQILLVVTFAHVIYFWRLIRRTLEPFDGTPMLEAFDNLPAHLLHDRLSPRRPGPADVRRVTLVANELGLQLKHMPADKRLEFSAEVGLDASSYKALRRVLRHRPRGFDDASDWAVSERWRWLVDVMRAVVPPVARFWRRGHHQPRAAASSPTVSVTQRWIWLAEEVIAMQTLLVIRELLARLAPLFLFLIVGVLLMVAIAQSFPFQPRQQLLATAWVYVIGAVMLVITTFVQIERDPVISALASTDAGKVNWDWTVWTKVLMYGGLPIATIFAAQFPQVGGAILDWLKPVQSVIP